MSNYYYQPPPYPIAAFFQCEERAAREVGWHHKAPDAINGMSMLFVMGVACQGLADMTLPFGEPFVEKQGNDTPPEEAVYDGAPVIPLSLNFISVAESGERKSTVDRAFAKPVVEHDEARESKYEAALAMFEEDVRIWDREDQSLGSVLDKRIKRGEPTDEIKVQIRAHFHTKPVMPRERYVICDDISENGVAEALHGVGESLALTTDEGSLLLRGEMLKNPARLNNLWDGRTLRVTRGKGKRLIGREPRVATNIMVPPDEFEDHLATRGKKARGLGYYARFLVGYPESTQGRRLVTGHEGGWIYLPQFHARVKALLEEYDHRMATGKIKRDVLYFTPEAKARWIQIVNDAESRIWSFGDLREIKDFVSKMGQNLARVAGILHYFAGEVGGVTVDTLERALQIMTWHMDEAMRLFAPQHQVPQELSDAEDLRCYLCRWQIAQKRANEPSWGILRSQAQAGALRGRGRFAPALAILEERGAIMVGYLGTRELGAGMRPGKYIQFKLGLSCPLY